MRKKLNVIMKNVFKVVLLIVLSIMVIGCNKEDDPVLVPIRDYATQYASDLDTIQKFLKTHSMTVVNHPGFTDDQDVTYTVVPELDPTSIWGSNATTHNANVLELPVEKDDITYIIYYLQLRQGSGATSKSPCNLDGVLTSYKGRLMNQAMKVFDFNDYPQTFFNLGAVIRGWSEIFPKFKTGSYTSNLDGTISYTNFGAGVMFVPSGLAYYSNSTSDIPSYSPLVFNFKLYEVQRNDNDGDGIPSYLEDRGNSTGSTPDGYIRDNDTTYEDDTDHDGTPDAFDVDDDGDANLTKEEIKYTVSGNTFYYPYNGAAVDDLTTLLIDERKGIPRKFTGANNSNGLPMSNDPLDFTDPTRLRRHLDATAKPPFSE